jgi:CxxC motif-containing protein (DUF1111 family)
MQSMKLLVGATCVCTLVLASGSAGRSAGPPATEAPAGFLTPILSDNPGSQSVSNGLPEPQGDTFATDQATFEEEEGVDKGLGPVYNARSCSDCHQNPVTGGISQVSEFRVGHDDHGHFVNPNITIDDGRMVIPNRSLVNDRAICPQAQERAPGTEPIHALRMSLNTLGDGFVEAIDDATLQTLALQQAAVTGGRIAGELIQVPVLEAPGKTRAGRFGWKDQHASLLSFASDAYLNEQGITNRLNLTDTTTLCKTTSDPEDTPDANGLADIDHFATFMRGTMAPPPDPILLATTDAEAGKQIFSDIGCALCHAPSITTAPAGTVINGGTFTVPPALGSKIIHPYGDFLLHDVGTGDGIVQNGPPSTANKMRTAPLWGLRTKDRLMHDGLSYTRNDAILRHRGEASFVTDRYSKLSRQQKDQLIVFLSSL